MTKQEFASAIGADKRLAFVDTEVLVRELAMHIAEAESVLGWMVLEARELNRGLSHFSRLAAGRRTSKPVPAQECVHAFL